MSRPRRPRLRLSESAESATSWSSRRTNCGVTMTPSRNPVSDIGDASVDDDAGVENLVAFLALLLTAEDAAEGGQVQQVSLIGADDEADVGHEQHDQDLQEALGVALRNAIANDEGEEVSATDSEETSNGGADEPFEADHAELPFEDDDCCAEQCAHGRVQVAGKPKGSMTKQVTATTMTK